MKANGTLSSKRLYQIVGISDGDGREVLMAGLELDQANAGREAVESDSQYVYVLVEREPQRHV